MTKLISQRKLNAVSHNSNGISKINHLYVRQHWTYIVLAVIDSSTSIWSCVECHILIMSLYSLRFTCAIRLIVADVENPEVMLFVLVQFLFSYSVAQFRRIIVFDKADRLHFVKIILNPRKLFYTVECFDISERVWRQAYHLDESLNLPRKFKNVTRFFTLFWLYFKTICGIGL